MKSEFRKFGNTMSAAAILAVIALIAQAGGMIFLNSVGQLYVLPVIEIIIDAVTMLALCVLVTSCLLSGANPEKNYEIGVFLSWLTSAFGICTAYIIHVMYKVEVSENYLWLQAVAITITNVVGVLAFIAFRNRPFTRREMEEIARQNGTK
jgi:hypothetical protein